MALPIVRQAIAHNTTTLDDWAKSTDGKVIVDCQDEVAHPSVLLDSEPSKEPVRVRKSEVEL